MSRSTITTVTPNVRKQRPMDKVPSSVLLEIKRAIAAQCLNIIAPKDMKIVKQVAALFEQYHGKGNIADQTKAFMKSQEPYSNVWEKVASSDGPQEIIPERLHGQYNKTLVANLNITEVVLERTYPNRPELLTGRSIYTYASDTLRAARKMLSVVEEAVKAKILEKKGGGEYDFASGKTEANFIEFLNFRMYNWKHFNGATESEAQVAEAAGEEESIPSSSSNETEGSGQDEGMSTGGPEAKTAVESNLQDPPVNWIPFGYFFFMTRGPLAEKKNRIDILGLNDHLDGKGGGRKDHRKEEADAKAAARDYEAGVGREKRGLSLGASTQKEVAVVAQLQAKLSHAVFEGQLIKLTGLLQSKQDQVKSVLQMADMYHKMNMPDKAKESMSSVESLLRDVTSIEKELHQLKELDPNDASSEVNHFLKRGRMAMGIDKKSTTSSTAMPANKKQKKSSKDEEADGSSNELFGTEGSGSSDEEAEME